MTFFLGEGLIFFPVFQFPLVCVCKIRGHALLTAIFLGNVFGEHSWMIGFPDHISGSYSNR